MINWANLPIRFVIALELLAMGMVRVHFGAPRRKQAVEGNQAESREPAWLTGTLGVIALLHFGAIGAYLVNPSFLQWSAFEAAAIVRWIGIALSSLGIVGEIWSAAALGTSYSPMLRVAEEHVVVMAGPYRWIRHPLYAFWLPVMAGLGVATGNWFIIASGTVLITVLAAIRVPREEAMMLQGLGESYRNYMEHTGRFIPRWRTRQAK